ncbi:hypothetical protein [Kitasatospora sp. KL5]|uniref:hypothetical protein n=1 Tax=Kitasatospora sp. KL5 TaxID=3425125 RepID=UPI003D6DB2BA
MTTTTSDQIRAAGALMSLLTALPHLPAPNVQLEHLKVPGTPEYAWGINVSLHHGLDHFEQWRQALGLDPADVDHQHHATTAWLTVTGTHSGVPLVLHGYYRHNPDQTGDER